MVALSVAVLLGLALSAVNWPIAGPGGTPQPRAQTEIPNAHEAGRCAASTASCSESFTTAAYAALMVFVQTPTTSTPTVAVNTLTFAQLGGSEAAVGGDWVFVSKGLTFTTSTTVTVYVNLSQASAYPYEVFDVQNTVAVSTVYSGSGVTDGATVGTNCFGLTTSVPNEMVVAAVAAFANESSITPITGTQLTVQNIGTMTLEDDYALVTSAGSYSPAQTLNSATSWIDACVGLLPASVPSAPTGLAHGTITKTTVPLTWTNPASPIVSDSVYDANFASGACGAFSSVYAPGSVFASHTVTGLVSGNFYCFEVFAANSTGTSAASNLLTGIQTLAVPGAPTGGEANPIYGSATTLLVQWTSPPGTILNQTLAKYAGGSCGGAAAYTNLPTVPTIVYTYSGLSGGTTYSFEIQAWNSTGEGAWSACFAGTTYALPGAPTSVAVTAVTATTVAIAWHNPSGSLVNDTVLYGTVCGTYTTQISTGIASAYNVTALSPYTTYCFAVEAWSPAGLGSVSGTVEAQTLTVIPAAPTYLNYTKITGTSVAVNWTNPGTASGALINGTVFYGATCGASVTGPNGNPGTWTHGISTYKTGTAYTVTGLSADTGYVFAVAMWTQAGQGPQSNCLSVTTLNPAPGVPTYVTYVSASHLVITLNWTQPVFAYTIVNNTVSYGTTVSCGGSRTYLGTGGAATTYTISSLSSATTYYVAVQAWSNGGESGLSSCVTMATQGATPPAPYSLAAQLVQSTWTYITWINPSGYSLTDNIVYVSGAGGSCGTWSQTNDIGFVSAAYNITSLSPGSTYCIEATAVDAQSNYSLPLYVTTSGSGGGGGGGGGGQTCKSVPTPSWCPKPTPTVNNTTVPSYPWAAAGLHYPTFGLIGNNSTFLGATYLVAQNWLGLVVLIGGVVATGFRRMVIGPSMIAAGLVLLFVVF
jgi:hypothetical protein